MSASDSGKAESIEDRLLQRIAGGDKDAFMEFYELYADRLFVFCRRMMKDQERAKDALQNSFIKVFERAGQYQHSSNAGAWVFRLTRNVCIDMIRAEKEYDELDERTIPQQEERPRDVLLQDALSSEIEALPPIYREAVLLRDVQGYSYREIAEIVDAPLSTIKFRIFKAREVLRERLRSYLADPDDT